MRFRKFVVGRVAIGALIALISTVGVFASVALEQALIKSERAEVMSTATSEALVFANAVRQKMAFHEALAVTTANAISVDPTLDQAEFSDFVAPFFLTNPGIVNVGVAEGMIVKFSFPLETNREVIGVDYRDVPDQLISIQEMQRTRSPVFSGPVKLVQGGDGYIHRAPVFINASGAKVVFWGLVSVVTREAELFSAAALSLSNKFDVAVSLRNPDSEASEFAWGKEQLLNDEPVVETIDFGGRVWEVALAPADGWPIKSSVRDMLVWLTVLAILLFVSVTLWARHLFLARISSWEQLSRAIEVIDDGFALYDANDKLVMCNSKYRSYYNASAHLMEEGASFEEIIRGGVYSGQYQEAVGREEEWIEERLRRHNNPTGPVEQLLDDGRWLKVFEAKMDDGSTVGFRVDITELKDAKQEAERANSAKTEFLNTLSHEIRTPLSAVIGYSRVLQNLHMTKEFSALSEALSYSENEHLLPTLRHVQSTAVQYASRIDTNGKHLQNIIDDLLYWTHDSQLANKLDFRVVNLKTSIQTIMDQLAVIADQKEIKMHMEVVDVHVLGDEVRLKQVLLNIVGNALKFTEAGSVTVQCGFLRDSARIRIVDTGCGIPATAFEEVFEPFKQLDSGVTRKYGGCGLGLTICDDIVRKHGGNISVSSELGVGSTFTVTLPLVTEECMAA